MQKLKDLIKRVKSLDESKELKDIYLQPDFQELVIDLNTRRQLFLGIDSQDLRLDSIGGEYSEVTKNIKRTKGQPIDRVTLLDEEDFYKSFRVVVISGGFKIVADTIKEGGEDLTVRWGKNIIGLNELSLSQVQFYVKDEIIKAIRKKIKGL